MTRNRNLSQIDTTPTRREFLVGGAAMVGGLWLAPAVSFAAEEAGDASLPEKALQSSRLVYISPLRRDGSESACHGEVWFFVDGDDVVMATSSAGWRVRAIRAGLDRARIWVGDLGPYKRGKTALTSLPHVDAQASIDEDPKVFERLMDSYARRYADEWGKWRPRFESGYRERKRLVIRYRPITS
jgi:hypothetical protein